MESAAKTTQLAAARQPVADTDLIRRRRQQHKSTKPQLLTRDQLDGRTNAAKTFDRLITEIEADLAGRDQLSAIERTLIEAYAGAYVSLVNLNTRLALGEEIDLSQHAQAVNAMVRVASRLGLQRRAKEVGGGLGDLMRLAASRTSDEREGEEGPPDGDGTAP